jgi:hypothetical protein
VWAQAAYEAAQQLEPERWKRRIVTPRPGAARTRRTTAATVVAGHAANGDFAAVGAAGRSHAGLRGSCAALSTLAHRAGRNATLNRDRSEKPCQRRVAPL